MTSEKDKKEQAFVLTKMIENGEMTTRNGGILLISHVVCGVMTSDFYNDVIATQSENIWKENR